MREDTLQQPPHRERDERPALLPEAEPTFVDFLIQLLRWKGRILAGLAAGAVIGALLAFGILKPVFTGRTTVMIPQQRGLTLPGQLAPLAALAGRDIGLRDPSDLYITLLKSHTVSDALIERFSLRELYQTATLSEARLELASNTLIQVGKDGRVLEVSVEDDDPSRAADMANAYVDELARLNDRLAAGEAAQRREFFHSRLEEERRQLAAAEEAMRENMNRTGVLEVEKQTEAMIRAAARVRAEISAREVLLERLKLGATDSNPEVRARQAEIASLRGQLSKLEANSPQASDSKLVPVGAMPAAGLSYIRRLRDVKYHEALFEILAKEYEIARIDESKEGGALQVVDRATVPDRKSGPPRGLIVVVFAILGAAGVLGWALAAAYLGSPANRMSAVRLREVLTQWRW